MSCGNRVPAVSALPGGVAAGGFKVGGVLGAEVLQLESLMPGGGPGALESPPGVVDRRSGQWARVQGLLDHPPKLRGPLDQDPENAENGVTRRMGSSASDPRP